MRRSDDGSGGCCDDAGAILSDFGVVEVSLELANVELNGGEFTIGALDVVFLATGAGFLAVAFYFLCAAAEARRIDLEATEVVCDLVVVVVG